MSPTDHPKDISHLRARRREARRRRYVARVDVGLGVLGALVLLLATPGLAITLIFALLVLGLCLLSVVLERRSARRSAEGDPPRPSARAGRPAAQSHDERGPVTARRPGRSGRASEAPRHAPALDRSATPPSQAREARRRSSSG